jgi:hypothetical protein
LALQRRPSGEGAKPPVLRWLKTVVVSDRGEGALDASGGDQEDVPESVWPGVPGWACAVEASLAKSRWHRKRGVWLFSRDEPGGCPMTGQVVPGVKAA